jgi:hypothetical protein
MNAIIINPIRNIFSGSWNRYLLFVLIGMFVLYSFFIARSVVAINQRKTLYSEIRTMQTKVSDLEIEYFNIASSIDIQKASALGFVESKTPTFAYTHPDADTVAISR